MIEHDLKEFIRNSIRSIWALELLLYLSKNAERAWSFEDLIRELRSSRTAILEAAMDLVQARLAVEQGGQLRYAPANAGLDRLAKDLVRAYVVRPVAIVRHIGNSPAVGVLNLDPGISADDKS